MNLRHIKIKRPEEIAPCPECGNREQFVACVRQCQEDMCEVWVECDSCGHDPFGPLDKIEDVWGSLDDGNVMEALMEWNRLLQPDEETS